MKEKVSEVIKKAVGKDVKRVASDLGLSQSIIYKWGQGQARNPIETIVALYRSTGDIKLIKMICQLSGGFYVPDIKDKTAHECVNRIYSEIADMLKVTTEANEDEHFTFNELMEMQEVFNSFQSVMTGFLHEKFKDYKERLL